MIEVEKVSPSGLFTNYIFKAIPLAFDESMSYYETLCGLLNYMKNTMIPALNNNADAVIEVQNLMTQLQNYVANYFDNLDVQEEINNKLDQMVEDGTLQEVVGAYLQTKAVFGFDSVSDLKASTNLINGSFAETYGFYNYNDGGGALYRIRTITNEDVVDNITIISLTNNNTLIAELIIDDVMSVEQFGAHGDGETNDTIYFTKAFQFAKELHFKNKTYVILGVPIVKDIVLIGDNTKFISSSRTIISGGYGDLSCLIDSNYDNDIVNDQLNEITIKNITFDGNKSNITVPENYSSLSGVQECGARIIRFKNVNIDNCSFINTVGDGLYTALIDNLSITNSSFKNNGQLISGTKNAISCVCYYWYGTGESRNKISSVTKNALIENCYFENTFDEIIRIDSPLAFNFNNNTCLNNGRYIIENFRGQFDNESVLNITNNYIENVQSYGFVVDSEHSQYNNPVKLNVTNNIIKNIGKHTFERESNTEQNYACKLIHNDNANYNISFNLENNKISTYNDGLIANEYAFIFSKSNNGNFKFINNQVDNAYNFTDRFSEIIAKNVEFNGNILNNYVASYGNHIKSDTIYINNNNINNAVSDFNLSRVFGVECSLINVENNNVNVLSSNSYPMFVRSMSTPTYVRFNNNVLQNIKFGYSIDSTTELVCFATNNVVTRASSGDIPKVANNVTSSYITNNYLTPLS